MRVREVIKSFWCSATFYLFFIFFHLNYFSFTWMSEVWTSLLCSHEVFDFVFIFIFVFLLIYNITIQSVYSVVFSVIMTFRFMEYILTFLLSHLDFIFLSIFIFIFYNVQGNKIFLELCWRFTVLTVVWLFFSFSFNVHKCIYKEYFLQVWRKMFLLLLLLFFLFILCYVVHRQKTRKNKQF